MIVEDEYGNRIVVNNNYDNKERIVSGSRIPEWKEITPTTQLSRSGYNWNRSSTRVNEERDATLIMNGHASFTESGLRKGIRKLRNW